MVEIKILVIDLIYLIFIEYATWQHDIGHYKLITSCMCYMVNKKKIQSTQIHISSIGQVIIPS